MCANIQKNQWKYLQWFHCGPFEDPWCQQCGWQTRLNPSVSKTASCVEEEIEQRLRVCPFHTHRRFWTTVDQTKTISLSVYIHQGTIQYEKMKSNRHVVPLFQDHIDKIRPFNLVLKFPFCVLLILYLKTICHVRPHFQDHIGGLKIVTPVLSLTEKLFSHSRRFQPLNMLNLLPVWVSLNFWV